MKLTLKIMSTCAVLFGLQGVAITPAYSGFFDDIKSQASDTFNKAKESAKDFAGNTVRNARKSVASKVKPQDEDEEEEKPARKKKTTKKAPPPPVDEDEMMDEDSMDEEEAPPPPRKSAKKTAPVEEEDMDDGDNSQQQQPPASSNQGFEDF